MIKSEKELSERIADASGGLRIVGGGTRGFAGAGDALNVSGVKGVRLYEPGALTLVAGVGTPLSEVRELLAEEGQRLAFEPMDHRGLLATGGTSTIGGLVAANISGPRRVQAGACRDFLLGVRFVDGMGRILKNGGRVMKNVTGYDLVKLMAGSFGTLGVLSEVSLKTLPKPETTAALQIEGLDDRAAVRALSGALGSPFDVTGAAHVPDGLNGKPVTMIRLEGFEDSVSYRAKKLRKRLAEYGEVNIETNPEKTLAGWQWIRDVEAFHNQTGDVWRISVKPSDGPSVAERLKAVEAQVIYDWGGGLVWALVPEGTEVRTELADINGHARIERAGDATKARFGVFPSEGVIMDQLAAQLRGKFDPRGILNPGLMG